MLQWRNITLNNLYLVRQIYEKLFPFGLQVSNLVLWKMRALEIVVDMEPRENLNFCNICTFYTRKKKSENLQHTFVCVCVLYHYKMLKVTRHHIPHHIGTKQCSSVLPSYTCTSLQCSLSYSHSRAVCWMIHWLQVRWPIMISSCWN